MLNEFSVCGTIDCVTLRLTVNRIQTTMSQIVFWCIFVLFLLYNAVFCGKTILMHGNDNEHQHLDNSNDDTGFLLDAGKLLKRHKRYLLWTNGGISKIVLGFLAPVETPDRVNWRTLNLAYNYQAQYIPIPNTTSLWQVFARDLRQQRKLYDEQGIHFEDMTRRLIYGAMELFHDTRGKSGRQCLLKSICDAAEHPIVRGGVFEEILHLIFTPNSDEAVDIDYKEARIAGERGEDCTKLYHCRFGDGFLDKFSYFT